MGLGSTGIGCSGAMLLAGLAARPTACATATCSSVHSDVRSVRNLHRATTSSSLAGACDATPAAGSTTATLLEAQRCPASELRAGLRRHERTAGPTAGPTPLQRQRGASAAGWALPGEATHRVAGGAHVVRAHDVGAALHAQRRRRRRRHIPVRVVLVACGRAVTS